MKKRFLILFIVFLPVLLSHSAMAAELEYDLKYDIDLRTDTITQHIKIGNNLKGGYYYESFDFSGIPKEVSGYSGSGDCPDVVLNEGEYDGEGEYTGQKIKYKYLTCFPEGKRFEAGETIELEVTGNCNCTSKWGGGIMSNDYYIEFYPYQFRPGDNILADIEQTIYAPKGYEVNDASIKELLSVRETRDALEISFKARLEEGQSLNDLSDDPDQRLFVRLRKKLDFDNIKVTSGIGGKYGNTTINVAYPVGYEKDAAEMVKEIQKILPYYESLAATTLSNMTVYVVMNESYSCDASGCAFQDIESVNISINSHISTLYHEICHLFEKPFDYSTWFAEGEATNCEINALYFFGKHDEARTTEEDYKNGIRLGIQLDLQNWDTQLDYLEIAENITDKGYGASYALMKEVFQYVNLAEFYIKARKDFEGASFIPNDAAICKLAEVSTNNEAVFDIFERYSFTKIESCEEAYKNVKPSTAFKILGWTILILIILLILFPIFYIPYWIIKTIKRKLSGKK